MVDICTKTHIDTRQPTHAPLRIYTRTVEEEIGPPVMAGEAPPWSVPPPDTAIAIFSCCLSVSLIVDRRVVLSTLPALPKLRHPRIEGRKKPQGLEIRR